MTLKSHAWHRRKYRVSVYKLDVQILSQTPFTKKRVTTQRVYKVKQRCGTILNLEEKMRWILRQAWPFQHHYILREVWDAHRRTGKHIYIYLISFIVLWSCTETVILTFNRLESIETNYMDTNPGMFSSKTLIYFLLKKEIHKHLGWHGGV